MVFWQLSLFPVAGFVNSGDCPRAWVGMRLVLTASGLCDTMRPVVPVTYTRVCRGRKEEVPEGIAACTLEIAHYSLYCPDCAYADGSKGDCR